MRALLNDLAEINNKDHASISYRFEPVSDHDNRLIVRKLGNGFHQFLFVLRVNVGGRFVHNDKETHFDTSRFGHRTVKILQYR